jgi:hypothetical protein
LWYNAFRGGIFAVQRMRVVQKRASWDAYAGTEAAMDTGNYEKAAAQAREMFLASDHEAIPSRGGVAADGESFFVRFLDAVYRVDRATGMVARSVNGGPYEDASDFTSSLTVFDYLCPEERGGRALSGEWTTTVGLGGHVHEDRTGGGFFGKDTAYCESHKDELKDALRRLGGVEAPVSDAGFILPILGDLPLYFQFWESDDEFPAGVTLLWDKNTLRYVHYETLYYIAELFFRRLRELLGER